ncbi:MAG: hypothetical protein ACLFTH_01495 [Candidatus Woesearchaeota archaeon]
MARKIDERKKLDKRLLFTVLILTAFVFIIGIMIGNYTMEQKFESLTGEYENLRLQLLSLDIQSMILEDDICKLSEDNMLTEELQEVAQKVSFLENSYGWDDPTVWQTKEQFFLLELRHWWLTKKEIEICENNKIWALYFYSNKGDCPKCQQQGTILTHTRQKNENFTLYHFDINMGNPALETVKRLYNITGEEELPVMVIDGEKYSGYQEKNEIQKVIESIIQEKDK